MSSFSKNKREAKSMLTIKSGACYAVKTAEANTRIETLVELEVSLQETVDYVRAIFNNDKDITEDFIICKYNYYQNQKVSKEKEVLYE